jgi:hypothetical protein
MIASSKAKARGYRPRTESLGLGFFSGHCRLGTIDFIFLVFEPAVIEFSGLELLEATRCIRARLAAAGKQLAHYSQSRLSPF